LIHNSTPLSLSPLGAEKGDGCYVDRRALKERLFIKHINSYSYSYSLIKYISPLHLAKFTRYQQTNYSTVISNWNKNLYLKDQLNSYNNGNSIPLNPWYVTGFTDAEGSFNILICKSPSVNIGWRVQIRFIIELHIKDIALLRLIKSFFNNVGTITVNKNKKIARYTVVNFNSIINNIIPHFTHYPLQSAKVIDFIFWKECSELMINKKHLNKEGLNKIVALKGVMNKKLKEDLKIAFPNHVPLIRPSYLLLCNKDEKLNPYWISGFIEGDGSFFINTKLSKSELVLSTSAIMSIGLDIREEPLLIKIKNYFGSIGNVYSYNSRRVVEFKIFKLDNINSIIPHFVNYPLLGLKSYNFSIWKEIVDLINNKAHFTKKGIQKIKSLKNKLNLWN